ncbi:hypothetical protein LCM4577_14015 [Mesorhizobium sp. LCM 4577]|nr:hypothetical protein LCM4577_14015 [Mesorhizobium sp. LCM 4577]
MPVKRETSSDSVQFSVTISRQAAAMIDQLIAVGLHGTTRSEVTRTLIHSRLEQLFIAGVFGAGAGTEG